MAHGNREKEEEFDSEEEKNQDKHHSQDEHEEGIPLPKMAELDYLAVEENPSKEDLYSEKKSTISLQKVNNIKDIDAPAYRDEQEITLIAFWQQNDAIAAGLLGLE